MALTMDGDAMMQVRVNTEMPEPTLLLDVAMIKSISLQSSICTALEESRAGQNALKLIHLL